jgi:hypothetical protein
VIVLDQLVVVSVIESTFSIAVHQNVGAMDYHSVGPGIVVGWLQGAVIIEVERHPERALFNERHVDFLAACNTEGSTAEATLRS